MESEFSQVCPSPGQRFFSGLDDEDLGLKFVLSLLPHSSSSHLSEEYSYEDEKDLTEEKVRLYNNRVSSKRESDQTSSEEFSDDDDEYVTEEQINLYNNRVAESEGFDVPDFAGLTMGAVKLSNLEDQIIYDRAKGLALMAIDHWNNDSNNLKIKELDHVIRLTGMLGFPCYKFITFRAKDVHNNKKNFEAEIAYEIVSGKDSVSVEFVRFQRNYPNAPGTADLV